jgi:hypothetical protein
MDPSVVLGITNAGIQAAGGVAANRDARAIRRAQLNQQNFGYQNQDVALQNQQSGLNREANYAGQDIQSNANDRGVLNSSIPQAAQQKLDYSHQQRYNAIQNQRTALGQEKMTADQVRMYSLHADKLKRMFGEIDAALGGGASGAMNQYSHGQMNEGFGT